MKKLLLLLIVLTNCLVGHAQFRTYNDGSKKTISISFDEKDFELVSTTDGTFIQSGKYWLIFDTDSLAPALPYIKANVLVGPYDEFDGMTLSISDKEISKGSNILTNIKGQQDSGIFLKKVSDYTQNEYPERIVKYMGTSTMHGFRFMSFLIYPFKFETVQKKLCLNSEISLTIQLKENKRENIEIAGSNDKKESVKRIAVNGNELDSLYKGIATIKPDNMKSSAVSYKYIIVTSNTLKPAFEKLAKWKNAKGIKTKILTTEEIYQLYSGATNHIKIKAALKDYLQIEAFEQQYALLGGDSGIIPTLRCWGTPNNNVVTTAATDYYYVCFDTMNWDTNGDGKYGTYEDSVSLDTHVAISRISVNTLAQANNVIDRIIEYEKNPNLNKIHNNYLSCGSKLTSYYPNGQSDTEYESEQFYSQYVSPNWNGQKYRFYDTATDFAGGASYDFTRNNFQSKLTDGYDFVNICSHGDYVSYQMEDDYQYNKNYASALSNNGYSIILTSTCSGNEFDSALYNSLCEEFMWNNNSGVISYIGGSSLVALSGIMEYIGPMLANVFTSSNHSLGTALFEAKVAMKNYCTFDTYHRFHLFCTNMLGDPEMPVYTSIPSLFTSVTVNRVGNNIAVNTGGVSGCSIAVTSLDNGESYFSVARNVSSQTFTNVPKFCHVVVSKSNFKPYYSIEKDLTGICIVGDTLITTTAEYYVSNLPSGATVTWTRSEPSITLENNVPSVNMCRLTRSSSSGFFYHTPLVAKIIYGDEVIATLTTYISSTYVVTGTYSQQSCVFNGTSSESIPSTNLNTTAMFVHQGCEVTVISSCFNGKTISYSGALPITWDFDGYQTLHFSLPYSSIGFPFYINVPSPNPSVSGKLIFVALPGNFSTTSKSLLVQAAGYSKWKVSIIKSSGLDDKDINAYGYTRSKNNSTYKLDIFRMSDGQHVVSKKNIDSSGYILETTGWKQGVYILRAEQNGDILTSKISVSL